MLIISLGGLSKKGKKNTLKKGAKSCRKLQKFVKSSKKRALFCKNLQKFDKILF